MKNPFKIASAAAIACAAFALIAVADVATTGPQSMCATNAWYHSAVTATSNQVAIDVRNSDRVFLTVSGTCTAASTANLQIYIYRSSDGVNPTNWDTFPSTILNVPMTGTTRLYFTTNLDQYAIGGAAYIQCLVSNASGTVDFTNAFVGALRKKLVN